MPPKKAAKKSAAKFASKHDEGKDLRRAYEHQGRVVALHSVVGKHGADIQTISYTVSGKTVREGMGQATNRPASETLDLVITNALIIDWSGIYKVSFPAYYCRNTPY